jgi:hypothetical protein
MISSSLIWIAGLRALIGDIRMPGCRAAVAGQAEKRVMQRSTVSRISLEASCRAPESLQNLILGKAITGSAPSSGGLEVNCGSYSTCLPKTEVNKGAKKIMAVKSSKLEVNKTTSKAATVRLFFLKCEQRRSVFRESRRLRPQGHRE